MNKNTPEVYHQKISTAFHTMIALPLAAFVYLFLERKHNDLKALVDSTPIIYAIDFAVTLVAGALAYFAYRNYKKGIRSIDTDSLRGKLSKYSSVSIQAYLYLGLAFVLLVVGLILTTSAVFIIDYLALLFLLSLQRPTPEKYIRDLALEGEDKTVVRDKLEFRD